jgi:hypothetical protein
VLRDEKVGLITLIAGILVVCLACSGPLSLTAATPTPAPEERARTIATEQAYNQQVQQETALLQQRVAAEATGTAVAAGADATRTAVAAAVSVQQTQAPVLAQASVEAAAIQANARVQPRYDTVGEFNRPERGYLGRRGCARTQRISGTAHYAASI